MLPNISINSPTVYSEELVTVFQTDTNTQKETMGHTQYPVV